MTPGAAGGVSPGARPERSQRRPTSRYQTPSPRPRRRQPLGRRQMPEVATRPRTPPRRSSASTSASRCLGLPALPLDVKLDDRRPIPTDAEQPGRRGARSTSTATGPPALGPGVSCRIQVFPIAWQSSDPDLPVTDRLARGRALLPVQARPRLSYADARRRSPWLLEGGAEWAGDQVAKEALGHDPHDSRLSNVLGRVPEVSVSRFVQPRLRRGRILRSFVGDGAPPGQRGRPGDMFLSDPGNPGEGVRDRRARQQCRVLG